MPDNEWLTLKQATKKAGVSENTLRLRIKLNQVAWARVPTPRGPAYRINLALAPGEHDLEATGALPEPEPPAQEPASTVLASETADVGTVRDLVRMVDKQAERIEKLEAERAELYGRLGFLQGENLALKAAVQPLELPATIAPPAIEGAPPAPAKRVWWRFWKWEWT